MKLAVVFCALAVLAGALFRTETEIVPREEYLLVIHQPEKAEHPQEETILLRTEGETVSLPMEEYLVGVVLTEMPPSFHPQALMAQAVAARTYAALAKEKGKHQDYDLCTDSGCCQAWQSQAELRQVFGLEYDTYVQKGKTAVNQTAGEVLTYEGSLIDAVYFSCSGGSSEPAKAVWGTDVPYLQAVESPGEENAAKFCTRQTFSFSEFRRILQQADSQTKFSVIPQDWVGEMSHSAGGGVASVVLAGCSFTGPEVRSLFSLPSAKFEMEVGNGEIVFTSYGYGHRVGMSQYGAEAMAKSGKDYREILTHYYTDVAIKKLSRT